MDFLKPNKDETLEQYKYRLYTQKSEYGLTWKDISDLILKYFDKKYSKDGLRHEAYGSQMKVKVETQESDGYVKVLIMNDLHIPYQRPDVFDEIEKHKNVDYIIFGGDLVDCKSCSFFDDFYKPGVEQELAIVHEFISKVNTIIDPSKTKIITIRGNHEYRYTRDIMRMQEKQIQKLLNPNMLSMLQDGFTVYEKSKNIVYKPIENFKYVDNFYIKLFDNLIVAHPLDFSVVDGKIDEKVADYFLNEHIAEKDDVIIYGHTHKFSTMNVNRRQGVYVIENSCLCIPQEYSKMGKLSFTPQNYGYTYLQFKEGQKIDLNDIKIVHLK